MSSKPRRVLAASSPLTDAGVERDADGIPTAIRLFRAGVNVTDHGVHYLTRESVRLLLAEQAQRGNRYAWDVNHASLDKSTPLENQVAVGSFAIEDRAGDVWAVDCRWTAKTREQHKAGEWPSISPAFNVDADGMIIGLINAALTPNPATHGAVRMAASRKAPTAPVQTIAASRAPTSGLRVIAADGSNPGVQEAARNELVRRGELTTTDPQQRERLESTFARYGAGASKPPVEHVGCRSYFRACTPEQARRAIEACKPARANALSERMGLGSASGGVQHRGRVSMFSAQRSSNQQRP